MHSMPVAFVAHGAPTLATDQEKGAELRRWTASMPTPRAVLVISAHWSRSPVGIGTVTNRELIYDFYGFPAPLYRLRYPAPGAPELAAAVEARLRTQGIGCEREPTRGLDHGAWVPLLHMYPEAEVPVLQISQPAAAPAQSYLQLGQALAPLRNEGVLILASGVLVHNLRQLDFSGELPPPAWAREFDGWCRDALTRFDVGSLLDYREQAPAFSQAHPSDEHFTPLLVAVGAAQDTPRVSFPIEGFEFGSLSRRCVQFG